MQKKTTADKAKTTKKTQTQKQYSPASSRSTTSRTPKK